MMTSSYLWSPAASLAADTVAPDYAADIAGRAVDPVEHASSLLLDSLPANAWRPRERRENWNKRPPATASNVD